MSALVRQVDDSKREVCQIVRRRRAGLDNGAEAFHGLRQIVAFDRLLCGDRVQTGDIRMALRAMSRQNLCGDHRAAIPVERGQRMECNVVARHGSDLKPSSGFARAATTDQQPGCHLELCDPAAGHGGKAQASFVPGQDDVHERHALGEDQRSLGRVGDRRPAEVVDGCPLMTGKAV
mmetsp:Transcript_96710/g.268974  ORF Transcript_96710/g.268974 Transcript_96710/m.268974 type:complete len:177 (-) Transcript_96710:2727-3257(-)